MRYMLLMIPPPYEITPQDFDPEAVARMMAYNTAMMDAGILINCDGLHPPSAGARVTFDTGKPVVTDGPFAEAKEVLGGYWIIDVASREEAVAWAMKCPAEPSDVIEIRRVQEVEEFPPDVQDAVGGFANMQSRKRNG